jgi:phosphosulfolactate phosphohydrolase-like enzyme
MRVAIELALKTNAPISLVCSGREAATVCCLDDVYCAGFLTNEGLRILSSSGRVARLRDSSKIALCLFEKYSTPVDALESSESADVLRKIGCDEDILIAASPNAIDIVPVFKATGRTGLVEVSNASDFSAKIPSRSGRNVQ